jgi:hypothetical protein
MALSFDQPMLMASEAKPLIGMLVGGPGMGKTSLGALFPDPIFIKTEDGTSSIDGIKAYQENFKRENVAVFGNAGKEVLFDSSEDVLGAVGWLRTAKHSRKTLVVDSLSRLEDIFVREVLDDEANPKAKTMNAAHGGYGTAWEKVVDKHREFLRHCKALSLERNMTVILIAHEALETIESPDVPAYMKAGPALYKGKKPQSDCQAVYVQGCDLVAFIRQDFFVSSEKTKKEIEKKGNVGRATNPAGARLISCHTTPANYGKNRWGIQDSIPFDLTCNPFEAYL